MPGLRPQGARNQTIVGESGNELYVLHLERTLCRHVDEENETPEILQQTASTDTNRGR